MFEIRTIGEWKLSAAGSEAVSVPRYSDQIDFPSLFAEYPTAPDYFATTYKLSADALRALQNDRFLKQVERAWKIPFYQRHWGAAAMEPGDIRSLDDLPSIPPFDVQDMREAIERQPPFGDLVALDPDHPMSLLLHTSGGTTGLPRPMIYSPRDREVMSIITGRRLHMQGVAPFDVVQIAVAQGLTNGGAMAREGVWKYSGAIGVPTGSGAQTSDRRQIEIMRAWHAKVLLGFPAYLRRLADTMRHEMDLDPKSLGIKSIVAHLGVESRESLEALWGAKAYDTYGTNECGSLASECREQSGMHVFGDAFVIEIVDPGTGRPKAPGERGVIYQTTLFKHLAPLVRFNSNDVSVHIAGTCSCGSHHPRIAASAAGRTIC